jgi:hypothetical protein
MTMLMLVMGKRFELERRFHLLASFYSHISLIAQHQAQQEGLEFVGPCLREAGHGQPSNQ